MAKIKSNKYQWKEAENGEAGTARKAQNTKAREVFCVFKT